MFAVACVVAGVVAVVCVWVVVFALCRQAAFNDRPLTARDAVPARAGTRLVTVVADDGLNGVRYCEACGQKRSVCRCPRCAEAGA